MSKRKNEEKTESATNKKSRGFTFTTQIQNEADAGLIFEIRFFV